MRAYEHEVPWPVLEARLAQLDEASRAFDFGQVLDLLRELVREYQPAPHDEALLWHHLAEPKWPETLLH